MPLNLLYIHVLNRAQLLLCSKSYTRSKVTMLGIALEYAIFIVNKQTRRSFASFNLSARFQVPTEAENKSGTIYCAVNQTFMLGSQDFLAAISVAVVNDSREYKAPNECGI